MKKQFHVHAVDQVDQTIALLTGLVAGELDAEEIIHLVHST